jgi:hypothetical protein
MGGSEYEAPPCVEAAYGRTHLHTTSFFYGDPGYFPLTGGWDDDGVDTPGLYRQSDGFVNLRSTNTQGVASP